MNWQPLSRSSGYVSSDGEDIYFERTGEGPPVVLCHGLGGNHAIWWRQIETLAAAHDVITWDQRGFGNSTARTGEIGFPAARRDLHAILEHLGLDALSLVGQSMGGWTALGYAQAHPKRIRSLILSATLAGANRKNVDVLIKEEASRNRMHRRQHPVLSAEFCGKYPNLGVLYHQISGFRSGPDSAGVLKKMAEDRLDLLALEKFSVPTLVLMAARDEFCPPEAMWDVVERLPHGRLRVIPGNHSVYYEDPATWNDAVLSFLRLKHCGTPSPGCPADGFR